MNNMSTPNQIIAMTEAMTQIIKKVYQHKAKHSSPYVFDRYFEQAVMFVKVGVGNDWHKDTHCTKPKVLQ